MQNPFEIFAAWYAEILGSGIKEPTAMTLATANAKGRPSSRIVLLKAFDERGFVFYTNSQSHKGNDLRENPQAALSFYWMDLMRQVRIEGIAEPVTGQEADDYYNSRALESRIGAWASKQSEILPTAEELLERNAEFAKKYGITPPRPPHWHGYRIKPDYFEFWQEGKFRLHERECFRLGANGNWESFKLYP